jgi:Flp pilus assembly pilin Flp
VTDPWHFDCTDPDNPCSWIVRNTGKRPAFPLQKAGLFVADPVRWNKGDGQVKSDPNRGMIMQSNSGDTAAEWAALTAFCGVLAIAAASTVGGEVLAMAELLGTVLAEAASQSGG